MNRTSTLVVLLLLPCWAPAFGSEADHNRKLKTAFKGVPSVEKVEIRKDAEVTHDGRVYEEAIYLTVNGLFFEREQARMNAFTREVRKRVARALGSDRLSDRLVVISGPRGETYQAIVLEPAPETVPDGRAQKPSAPPATETP